eukprot:TRINITY_DN4606_c1_g1_i1.p1 TRINITY_DN4606_c1_g1~~TRINITY_DN4606_c1_g1_i1.p1  ORF type:complete len:1077 (-),score=162.45 TRINITY_DN4606_c1_g1_i1:445-3675(-)
MLSTNSSRITGEGLPASRRAGKTDRDRSQKQFVLPVGPLSPKQATGLTFALHPALLANTAKQGKQGDTVKVHSAREPRAKDGKLTSDLRLSAKPGLVKSLLKNHQLQPLGLGPPEDGTPVVKDTTALTERETDASTRTTSPGRRRPMDDLSKLTQPDTASSKLRSLALAVHAQQMFMQMSAATQAHGLPELTSAQAAERQKSLSRCFSKRMPEILATYEQIYTWRSTADILDSRQHNPELSDEARKLVHILEDAKLPKHIRPSRVEGSDERVIQQEHGAHGHDTCFGISAPVEIASAISFLNFVRWLCGLPEVIPSASKRVVCDAIGQALQPRTDGRPLTDGGFEVSEAAMKRGPIALGKHLQDIIVGNNVSVLHGEGSLVTAVEQSLKCTHMCREPTIREELDQAAEQVNLARNVTIQVLNADRKPAGGGARRRAVANAVELPASLRHLKVLWDLQPDAHYSVMKEVAEETQKGMANGIAAPTTSRRVRAVPMNQVMVHSIDEEIAAEHFGMDPVWGDRRGVLSFRRCLLSPSLRTFAAVRCDDNCVFWTGARGNTDFEDVGCRHRASVVTGNADHIGGQGCPEAVCYPPPGLVPVQLAEGRTTPWTIMPDSFRFQPTSKTKIRIWRVKYERNADGKPCKAVRVEEVKVNGFSIDCSTTGEPFCVIFWPYLGRGVKEGDQLEVQLSGLCGEKQEMTMFYEFFSILRKTLDKGLVKAAAQSREEMEKFNQLWYSDIHKVSRNWRWSQGQLQTKTSLELQIDEDEDAPGLIIEPVTYQDTEITCTSGMLMMIVRCREAALLLAELHVRRFAGETTEVDRAAHTRFLGEDLFMVWVKIPMPRYRYEVRFAVSSHEDPRNLITHSFKYQVSATPSCPVLVRSIEDPLMQKFGYANIQTEAYFNGVTLLAPMKYRVTVGKCYFLVHLDKQKALEAAVAALAGNPIGEEHGEPTNLFSRRLLPEKDRRIGHHHHHHHPQTPKEVTAMHQILRECLESRIQDSHADIHFDVVLHDGQHIQRLRQRPDLPELFEGLIKLGDQDVSTKIRMQLRFPRIHAVDFSPRRICEWLVCRADEQFHELF